MRETIYVALLNEGTDVWKAVQGIPAGDGRFRLLGPRPDDEDWEFAVGQIVSVERRTFSDGDAGWVAVRAD